LIEYLFHKEKLNEPCSAKEIIQYVLDTFQKDVSHSWPYSWQKTHSDVIKISNDVPLESKRAEITVESLKQWGKTFKNEIEQYDYRFVLNWD
jgi:hypothetical protein